MEQKKLQKEIEELKSNPEKVRAMIAILEELLEEDKNLQAHVNTDSELDEIVQKHLREIGVSPKVKGYKYLREAIFIVVKNPDKLYCVTRELYVDVANVFKSDFKLVERSIRYAIENCWDNTNIYSATHCFSKYFGEARIFKTGRPCNTEFIAAVANEIRKEIS